MFGMSMTELIIIGVLALILIGPDELPNAARTIGRTLKEIRKAGDDLRETFDNEIMKEVKDLKKPFEAPANVIAKGKDLLKDVRATIEKAAAAPPTIPASAPRPPLAVAPPSPATASPAGEAATTQAKESA